MSAVGSAVLALALGGGYLLIGSELALAQAADSLLDAFSSAVLTLAVRVAVQPGDARHPFGHHSAEPLAAMAVAVLAGILGFQVAAEAVAALWSGSASGAPPGLAWLFIIKAGFRGALVAVILRIPVNARGPALSALLVDARNDMLLALASLAGVGASALGYPRADPLLAFPIALWIGWSGIRLGHENVRMLMGEAPSEERARELLAAARALPDIRGVHDLRARHVGNKLEVHVHVVVDPALTVAEAHDIGERVRQALEHEWDVERCHVHLDVTDDERPAHQASGPDAV